MLLNAGLAYESKIRQVVRDAARVVPKLSLSSIGGKTQSDVADVTLIFEGDRIPVEVKLDGRAQMGSPMTVILDRGKFSIRHDDSVDRATEEMILAELSKKQLAAKKLIDFIKSYPPSYNFGVSGFPVTCSKKAWDDAVTRGLLSQLNATIKHSVEIITRHYEKKNTHYIQIGKQGLFHMGSNPLGLPIPKLSGEVNIEFRMAHHGAKPNKEVGERVTADYRAQARMLTRVKSPFSLDVRDHVLMLFGPSRKKH